MRIASELTVATTSPVGTVRVSASPVSAAWCPMSCAERKAPCIQFMTAYLWRIAPEAALSTTSPMRMRHHCTSDPASPPMMPSSMALPMAAGKSAWLTSQTMPNAIATTRVRHWPLPTHFRYAVGLVRSGVPGSAWGSEITWCSLGSATGASHVVFCRDARSGGRVGARTLQGVGELVHLEGVGVDAPVAVGRAADEVGRDGRGEELRRGQQDERRHRSPRAQGQRQPGEDEDEAERLRLGRSVQARERVGEPDKPDRPGEAEESPEQQADRAGAVEQGPPRHGRSRPSVGTSFPRSARCGTSLAGPSDWSESRDRNRVTATPPTKPTSPRIISNGR